MRSKKVVYGCLLRISKVHDETIAQMITGLTSDLNLHSPALLSLFDKPDISTVKYQEYVDSLDVAKRQTTLLKGVVTMTPGVMNVELQSIDRDDNRLMFRCSSEPGRSGEFLGALGLAALVGSQGLNLMKMGIVKENVHGIKPMPMDHPEVARLLELNKLPNERINLSMQESTEWDDLIISSQEN